MQKNEGRKNPMVNVLKLEIGHINGVLTLVIAKKKMQQMEALFISSHWVSLHSSLLVGQVYSPGLNSAYPAICCSRSGGCDPHL